MSYYDEYSVVIERYSYSGYPDYTMTLYPHRVCNDPYSCPGSGSLPASVLEIRYLYTDACSTGVYEAYDMGGYADPLRSAVLEDHWGSYCSFGHELTLEIEHRDGTREWLKGYRIY